MDNITDSQDDREKNGQIPGAQDSINKLKTIYNTTKKVVQATRWLFSFMSGGWPLLAAIVIGALIAIAFISVVSGLMSPIPGGSIPTWPGDDEPMETIPGLTLKLDGPQSINNGEKLKYIITVIYDPSVAKTPLEDITIYDNIPSNAAFDSAPNTAFTLDGTTILWPMTQNKQTIVFFLKPTQVDTTVSNRVYAKTISTPGSSGPGASPTTESCGGKYNLAENPIGSNFGDPDCKFNKDDLYSRLQSLDPTNADGWYFNLVYCETGGTYNPNAFNPVSTSGTAWGLFQMGHEEYPSFGISKQMNNQYDRGDVSWQIQASNAVSYNKQRGDDFAYWGCTP